MYSPHLPPGFRFHPTDEELIVHYLNKKVSSNSGHPVSIIADIDLYKFSPWDLPGKALFGDGEWFFFTPRDRKYPNGARPNRTAGCGYWKATGTDKPILNSGGLCIGVKKALVFYEGRPPKGLKTDWVMNEYRLRDDSAGSIPNVRGSMRLDDWVLCRVRQKNNIPRQIADHYEDSSMISSMVPEKSPVGGVQEEEQTNSYFNFQAGGGGHSNSTSTADTISSYSTVEETVVSAVEDDHYYNYKPFKRTISVASFGEEFTLTSPRNKRLQTVGFDAYLMEDSSIFEGLWNM